MITIDYPLAKSVYDMCEDRINQFHAFKEELGSDFILSEFFPMLYELGINMGRRQGNSTVAAKLAKKYNAILFVPNHPMGHDLNSRFGLFDREIACIPEHNAVDTGRISDRFRWSKPHVIIVDTVSLVSKERLTFLREFARVKTSPLILLG